jgi:hypothetical protein
MSDIEMVGATAWAMSSNRQNKRRAGLVALAVLLLVAVRLGP